MTIVIDEITQLIVQNPSRVASERQECQCCDMWHLHGLDICIRIVSSGSREARRRRRQRRVVFRGSHGSASTWIMPVPVRPTRTCPWNSRSRVRLDASLRSECPSRLQPQFGRNFVGQILTLLFPRKFLARTSMFYQCTKATFRHYLSVHAVTRVSNFRYLCTHADGDC